jgi:hypothetical protein
MRIAYHFGFSSLLYVDSIDLIGLKAAGVIYEDWFFPFLNYNLISPLANPRFLAFFTSYELLETNIGISKQLALRSEDCIDFGLASVI